MDTLCQGQMCINAERSCMECQDGQAVMGDTGCECDDEKYAFPAAPVCFQFCPIGYEENDESMTCDPDPSAPDLTVHFWFESFEQTGGAGLHAKRGLDNEPETVPSLYYKRGLLFRSDDKTILQLPPYSGEDYVAVLPPEFYMSMWISPLSTSGGGTLIAKTHLDTQDPMDSSMFFSITLDNYVIIMFKTIGFGAGNSDQEATLTDVNHIIKETWSHIAVNLYWTETRTEGNLLTFEGYKDGTKFGSNSDID